MSIETATPCPVCGAYSGTTLQTRATLAAVCDVLVVKALESVGKRIVRADRSRFAALAGRPWHMAHTIWTATSVDVRGLSAHWEVLPAMIDGHGLGTGTPSARVVAAVDTYTRGLIAWQRPHTLEALQAALSRALEMTPCGR